MRRAVGRRPLAFCIILLVAALSAGASAQGINAPLPATCGAGNANRWTGTTWSCDASGGGLSGSGTAGTGTRFTAATTLGNASFTDDGTTPTMPATTIHTMGGGSGTGKPIVTANVNLTSAATTGTTKQTLASYSLPASSFNANGRCVRITVWYITAANANSKTETIDFGATTVISRAVGDNNGAVHLYAIVCRTGANTQEAIGTGYGTGGSYQITRSTPAETDTGAITIAATATTATASGDTTFKGMLIEFMN